MPTASATGRMYSHSCSTCSRLRMQSGKGTYTGYSSIRHSMLLARVRWTGCAVAGRQSSRSCSRTILAAIFRAFGTRVRCVHAIAAAGPQLRARGTGKFFTFTIFHRLILIKRALEMNLYVKLVS